MTRSVLLLGFLLLVAGTTAAHAQDTALDRVQNLIATGRFTDARNTLEEWERRYADARSDASAADRARALYLRGTLATDAKEAEDAFVAVVLSHPSSAVAPAALLRLGQGLLTAGEPRRAVAYLERLHSDYPGTPQRETGWVWLARAQLAAGAPAAACNTARNGVGAVSESNLRTLLELEREQACGRVGTQVAADSPPDVRAGEASAGVVPARVPQELPPEPEEPARRSVMPGEPAVDPEPSRPAPIGVAAAPPREVVTLPAHEETTPTQLEPTRVRLSGEFAVQSAAFRERSSADVVAGHLRERGFDARVTLVANSPLHRVRVGAFATSAEAAAVASLIRDAGYVAVIVNDVQQEH